MILLYSNTPNPIVFERFKAISNGITNKTKLYYISRKASKIKMPFLEDENIEKLFTTNETRNTIAPKLFYILKTAIFFRSNIPKEIYCFYPDMLLAAIIIKIFRPSTQIFYEIQDLNNVNLFFRAFHSFLMLFVKKIFITAPLFINEYMFFTKKLESKTVFIGNAPYRKIWEKHLGEKIKNKILTVGFIGMLRDKQHLDDIEMILERTPFEVLQAGACTYPDKLNLLKQKYPKKLKVFGAYNPIDLYKNLYPKIDIIWSSYPNNRNYNLHISRRFTEALALNRAVVVAKHAKGMNLAAMQKKYDYILSPDVILNLSKNEISNLMRLEYKWQEGEFCFDKKYDLFIKELSS